MAEYRRITRQCARDDWGCRTHADVVRGHHAEAILKRFFSQDPCTWYDLKSRRDRRRDVRQGQPAPGKRIIGSVKVEGYRAWVWEDDGSVYAAEDELPGFDLHWMIAYGNRRLGHRSDLQEKRRSLLEDPDDEWRPSEEDYADVLREHDDGYTERSLTALREAVARAESEHNTVIPIMSPDISGDVVHEHDEDVVEGVVIDEINERWVLLAKRRKNGRPLPYRDAESFAYAVFPEEVFPETVAEKYNIRGDLLLADPETHYIFYGALGG